MNTYRMQARAWIFFDVKAETEESAMSQAKTLLDHEENKEIEIRFNTDVFARDCVLYPCQDGSEDPNDQRDLDIVDVEVAK